MAESLEQQYPIIYWRFTQTMRAAGWKMNDIVVMVFPTLKNCFLLIIIFFISVFRCMF